MKIAPSSYAILALTAVSSTSAFAPMNPAARVMTPSVARSMAVEPRQEESESLVETSHADSLPESLSALTAAGLAALTTAVPESAWAAGPDWGLFEGRTGSLIHPVMMGSLFLYSCYTAFLGFQWRRQRTMGDDIKALKATLPAIPTAPEGEEVDAALAASVAAQAAPIQQELDALTQERKELAAANPRDQHFSQGALLAFLGTAIAIEGCLNTYSRAGKLFPGPHLYAGAGLVVLWGLAVSTVPAMQKGDETARTVHIGANVATLGLFAWQVQSGIPILLKVWDLTKWP